VATTSLGEMQSPEETVKVMRAASAGDADVQEILAELHTYLPLPHAKPNDRLADLMGIIVGHDREAHEKAMTELQQQSATKRVSESLFDFDLRAVPDWIPEDRRKLYAEVVVLVDQILGNDLAEGADEILHFFAGAFIKYGSEPALANSASDIATAISISFVGIMTEVPEDRDEKIIADGQGHLLEIMDDTESAIRLAYQNDPLPASMRRFLEG
jgi:hypothetical protein